MAWGLIPSFKTNFISMNRKPWSWILLNGFFYHKFYGVGGEVVIKKHGG